MEKKLILGTVQMGIDYGINNVSGKISLEDSCSILQEAFKLGVDTLDSAEAYGNAHQVIGHFHKLNPETRFKIITKIPHGITSNEIKEKVLSYINDLNVDCLDVLMFHSFDSYYNNRNIVDILESLKQEGYINNLGVSVYTNEQIDLLLDDKAITVVQLPFNLLDNGQIRGNFLKKLKKNKKIVHTRSAFLQGLFFKKTFNEGVSFQLRNELEAIKTIAGNENVDITTIALSYCLMQDSIDKVLIGVDSIQQLRENIAASNYHLSSDAVSNIEAIKVNNLDLLNPSLWK